MLPPPLSRITEYITLEKISPTFCRTYFYVSLLLNEIIVIIFSKAGIIMKNKYNDIFRPQVHFTAKNGWINDPNGLIYIDGTYHMFYQYDPTGIKPEKMHWGHATSRNLIHWQEQDIALFPDERGDMWSGSAILDNKNLIGKNTKDSTAALLFYTTTEPFVQNISYSTDGFKTIKSFEGNPVLPHIMGTNRDPLIVFCDELDCYVMALHLKTHLYALLKSKDLINWTKFQTLEMKDAECPDLFPITDNNGARKWVFMGASDNYIVGNFINGRFEMTQEEKRLHYGNASYAGQSFSNLKNGRVVRVAWNRGWFTDTTSFAGQMGIAMELTLCEHGGKHYIEANPVKEIKELYSDTVSFDCLTINKPFECPLKNTPYIIRLKSELYAGANLTVSFFGVELKLDFKQKLINLGDCQAPLTVTGSNVSITLVVDRCSTELFADGGKIYMSCLSKHTLCDMNDLKFTAKSDTSTVIDNVELISLESIHK